MRKKVGGVSYFIIESLLPADVNPWDSPSPCRLDPIGAGQDANRGCVVSSESTRQEESKTPAQTTLCMMHRE